MHCSRLVLKQTELGKLSLFSARSQFIKRVPFDSQIHIIHFDRYVQLVSGGPSKRHAMK